MSGHASSHFCYDGVELPIRPDLVEAHRHYWARLAEPGAWWSGAERVAIARETRNAWGCAFCSTLKGALSPYTVAGEHDHDGGLPERAVDAVHRIVTDQSRITRSWVEGNAAAGLSKGAYVELVGVTVAVLSIDEFHRALGMPLEPLPEPQPGEISRYRPAHLSEDIGFVPTVPPDGAVGNEADLWPKGRTANVVRALTLVPDALRDWKALSDAQYLSFEEMGNFGPSEARALDRTQIELVAARVSSINECFY